MADTQEVVAAAPLLVTPAVVASLHALRDYVRSAPVVDVRTLAARLTLPKARKRHGAQMNRQTISIPGPWPFYVTLSIEHGHPIGAARHMSMSVDRLERLPSPEALRIIATELGFGPFDGCTIWPEKLSDGRSAINMVEPIGIATAGSA